MAPTNAWLFQGANIADESPRWGRQIVSDGGANGQRVNIGDHVYYWQSGPRAGIYVTGIVSEPPTRASHRRLYRLPVTIDRRLPDDPLLRAELLHEPLLAQLDVLRRPWGANFFRVTSGQHATLVRLLRRRASFPRLASKHRPPDDEDERQLQARRVRRGQPAFRAVLRRVYGDRCAVTGDGPQCVLDACHIRAHAVSGQNDSRNGLLLRSDIHDLFDDGLLRIDPVTLRCRLHHSLHETGYWKLQGRIIRQRNDGYRPNKAALNERWVGNG